MTKTMFCGNSGYDCDMEIKSRLELNWKYYNANINLIFE